MSENRVVNFFRAQRWWMGRALVLPVHLFAFALVVFFMVRMIPGDPVATLTGGQNVSQEKMDQIRESLGLTGSIAEQLWTYLKNTVSLNFGDSMVTGISVWSELSRRLFETVELAVIAMVLTTILTVVLGMVSVMKPRGLVARVAVPYGRSAGAVPDFILGIAGIFLFYTTFHILPAPNGRYDPLISPVDRITGFPLLDCVLSGNFEMLSSQISHLILPISVLVIANTPLLLKIFLRALEDSVDAAPTRFRIASGASRKSVLLSVGRRAAPAAVAMLGTLFGFMLGGVVIVEQLFAMPGMGLYGVTAVNASDRVALQGFLLMVAAVSLVVFLVVDIINMLLDPRRRPGRATEGS